MTDVAETVTTTETPNSAGQSLAPEAPSAGGKDPRLLSFSERMEAAGWNPDDDPAEGDDEESEVEEAVEGAPGDEPPEKTERPKVVDAAPDATEQEQLRALATKLGYELDGKQIVARERIGFREWRRQQVEGLEQRRQQVHNELGQMVQAAQSEIEFGRKARQLLDQGDFDGLAAHYGKKDWNDLNTTALTAASDPQWKANLETRRELEKVRQEREAEKRQLQQYQEQQRAQVETQRWHANLSEQMKASSEKLLAEFADDHAMRNAILEIQRHYYHQSGGRELPLSAEQAMRVKMPGQSITLEQQMRGLYDRLGKALGETPAPANASPPAAKTPEPESATVKTPPAKNGKRPAPKTGTVDPEQRTSAARRDKWTREEWNEHFRKTMRNAIDEDESAERTRARAGVRG